MGCSSSFTKWSVMTGTKFSRLYGCPFYDEFFKFEQKIQSCCDVRECAISFDVSTRVWYFLTQEAGTSEGPKIFWAIHGAAHQGWAMSPMPPLPSSSGLIRKLLIKVLSANLEIERIVSRLQDLNVFFVIWSKVVCNVEYTLVQQWT